MQGSGKGNKRGKRKPRKARPAQQTRSAGGDADPHVVSSHASGEQNKQKQISSLVSQQDSYCTAVASHVKQV